MRYKRGKKVGVPTDPNVVLCGKTELDILKRVGEMYFLIADSNPNSSEE